MQGIKESKTAVAWTGRREGEGGMTWTLGKVELRSHRRRVVSLEVEAMVKGRRRWAAMP